MMAIYLFLAFVVMFLVGWYARAVCERGEVERWRTLAEGRREMWLRATKMRESDRG